jgi:hypothetical protein
MSDTSDTPTRAGLLSRIEGLGDIRWCLRDAAQQALAGIGRLSEMELKEGGWDAEDIAALKYIAGWRKKGMAPPQQHY